MMCYWLQIGGICVVPVGDSLIQITRLEEKKDERKVLLPVSFANLISPKDNKPRIAVELRKIQIFSACNVDNMLCRIHYRHIVK